MGRVALGNKGKVTVHPSHSRSLLWGPTGLLSMLDEGPPEVRLPDCHQALHFSEGLLGVTACRPQPQAFLLPLLLSTTKTIHLQLQWGCVTEVLVAPLCPTLCNPTDCSPPGSSVYGISQARILEWVAIPFSRGSSRPRDWTQLSCTAGRFFAVWTTREASCCVTDLP